MEHPTSAPAKALEEMSLEELRARCAQQEKDIERFVWNLAGCDTLASGWMQGDTPFNEEMALPALKSVARMARTCCDLSLKVDLLTRERDAAESRFVTARTEAEESEQHVVILENQVRVLNEKLSKSEGATATSARASGGYLTVMVFGFAIILTLIAWIVDAATK